MANGGNPFGTRVAIFAFIFHARFNPFNRNCPSVDVCPKNNGKQRSALEPWWWRSDSSKSPVERGALTLSLSLSRCFRIVTEQTARLFPRFLPFVRDRGVDILIRAGPISELVNSWPGDGAREGSTTANCILFLVRSRRKWRAQRTTLWRTAWDIEEKREKE